MDTDFDIGAGIKGRVAESLATVIFEQGGYRFGRFGIENLFREAKQLTGPVYYQLDKAFRSMPDFFVMKSDMREAFPVEVKFRRRFTQIAREGIAKKIDEQRKNWKSTRVLVFLGESPGGTDLTANSLHDFIRVVLPSFDLKNLQGKQADANIWNRLSDVREVFSLTSPNLDKIVPLLRALYETPNDNGMGIKREDVQGRANGQKEEPTP